LLKKVQDEIVLINEELYKKAETEHIDRIFSVLENQEERLKGVESLKVMAELGQATQEERLNTLKYKMEAFEHKMGVVVQRLSQVVNGHLDQSLTQPTEELALQKKHEDEQRQQQIQVGNTGGVGNRELTDKVQRIYH